MGEEDESSCSKSKENEEEQQEDNQSSSDEEEGKETEITTARRLLLSAINPLKGKAIDINPKGAKDRSKGRSGAKFMCDALKAGSREVGVADKSSEADSEEIDPFIKEWFKFMVAQNGKQKKVASFLSSGGIHFNPTRKEEFKKLLEMPPGPNRNIPLACPRTFIDFNNLMSTYGFKPRHFQGKSQYHHPEFIVGGKLHLIKKAFPTEKVKKLRKPASDPVVVQRLHPLRERQANITEETRELLAIALELIPGVITDLSEYAKAIAEWSSKCEKELDSMMSLWNFCYSSKPINGGGGLLAQHLSMIDVIEALLCEARDRTLILGDISERTYDEVMELLFGYVRLLNMVYEVMSELSDALLFLKQQQH